MDTSTGGHQRTHRRPELRDLDCADSLRLAKQARSRSGCSQQVLPRLAYRALHQ